MPNFWEICTVMRFVNLSEPEVWIPLKHPVYVDAYFEVSDQGRIRFVWKNDRHKEKYKEVCQYYNSAQKCMRVYFGENVSYAVHNLVAEAFLPNPNNRKIVAHLDGDKRNNKLSNLLWKADLAPNKPIPVKDLKIPIPENSSHFRERANKLSQQEISIPDKMLEGF